MTQGAAYAAAGYSPQPAAASRLSRNVNISARAAELKGTVAAKTEISMERIAEELRRVAFSDIRDVVKIDPKGIAIRPSEDWTPEHAATVAEISETDKGQRIRMHPKLDAIEKLNKMFGYYAPEKHDHKVSLEALVAASYQIAVKKEP